ncbi:hypothetical protein CUS89_06970 [Enterococcus mundtii]|uniref:Uncharacterized protein n=1 Tax=Enterococcus mundtii TaxID=53346 RepID=A0A2S7RV14_ENTMU|nr:hypothetical protein CUS89_06970 [Enterococcus mundtii]
MTKKIVCYTIVYSLEVIYVIYIFSSNIALQEVFSLIAFNSSVYKKFLIELVNPKFIVFYLLVNIITLLFTIDNLTSSASMYSMILYRNKKSGFFLLRIKHIFSVLLLNSVIQFISFFSTLFFWGYIYNLSLDVNIITFTILFFKYFTILFIFLIYYDYFKLKSNNIFILPVSTFLLLSVLIVDLLLNFGLISISDSIIENLLYLLGDLTILGISMTILNLRFKKRDEFY